jgi:hypothetical protein
MTTAVLASALAPSSGAAASPAENAVMLTVFLKHDLPRPLSEFNGQLQRQGYYEAFPPEGIEVVVRDDGSRSGGEPAAAGVVVARSQPYPREHRLAQLPHRIPSDL